MSEAMVAYLVARAREDSTSGSAHIREPANDFLAAYDLYKLELVKDDSPGEFFDFTVDE